MRTPKKTEQEIQDLIGAWARLAAEETFADYNLNQFKAVVGPSLMARAKLEEIRLDFEHWLIERMKADEVSVEEYLRVINGIRCHAKHGNNSAILRACGYVLEMERNSGLTRGESLEEPAPPRAPGAPPPDPAAGELPNAA